MNHSKCPLCEGNFPYNEPHRADMIFGKDKVGAPQPAPRMRIHFRVRERIMKVS